MIGGGIGVFGVLATEGSGEWVMLLVIISGDSVDIGCFGEDRGGGPESRMSLADWELSEETYDSPDSDSASDGSGDGGSAR